MKAIVYRKYGSPDVLQLEEVPKPTPEDDEVLVKVHAASINSWDWDLLTGRPLITRIEGLLRPKYKILGADVAGTVEAVGDNVMQFRPGDEVFGDVSACGWGGFAEYVAARENALTPKPASMTFEDAAAVPQAAVLALQSLRYNGQVQAGQRILINGAGGGAGTFAVQIAKSFGAEVTGVDNAWKQDVMRTAGADHVIDYTQQDYTRNGLRYDRIIDLPGNRSIFNNRRSLNPGGTYIMIGGSLNRILQTFFVGSMISIAGSKKMGVLLHKPNKDIAVLCELLEAGKIAPIIDSRYSLSEAREAFRHFGEGQFQGKIVITV